MKEALPSTAVPLFILSPIHIHRRRSVSASDGLYRRQYSFLAAGPFLGFEHAGARLGAHPPGHDDGAGRQPALQDLVPADHRAPLGAQKGADAAHKP